MKKNMRGLTWAILSISLLTVMAGAAVAPALGAVKEHFADCSPMMVQFVVSLPALLIIVTTFFFRPLCRLMRTRTLALVGLSLYVVAGAGAFLANSIGMLLVLRALLGVSVGMIMPLSTGLLSFYFPPEEQSRLMGLSAAMNQMGGVVATLLAGVLATVQWNYAFLVYLAGLLAIVLVATLLPNERLGSGERRVESGECGKRRVENREWRTESGEWKVKNGEWRVEKGECRVENGEQSANTATLHSPFYTLRLLRRFHPSVVSMLLVMLLFFVYPTNFAITAAEAGVGPIATTLIMVGLDVVAFFVGLAFGWMMGHIMRWMKYIAPAMFMAGYAVLALAGGVGGMIVGSVLIGLANGVGVPYVNTIASIKGGRDAAVTVMPLISASLYLGQFLSPLVVSPLAGAIGCSPYVVAAGIAVLFLLHAYATRHSHALPPRGEE